jgi:hypothetical protein
MDPIKLIMTALTAGARAAARDGSPALADAYAGLMALAQERLRGRPNGAMVLRQHAEDPARWARPLAKALEAEGAAGDEALTGAAQALLRLTDEAGFRRGKYAMPAPDAG